jgi:hypothetical protein
METAITGLEKTPYGALLGMRRIYGETPDDPWARKRLPVVLAEIKKREDSLLPENSEEIPNP